MDRMVLRHRLVTFVANICRHNAYALQFVSNVFALSTGYGASKLNECHSSWVNFIQEENSAHCNRRWNSISVMYCRPAHEPMSKLKFYFQFRNSFKLQIMITYLPRARDSIACGRNSLWSYAIGGILWVDIESAENFLWMIHTENLLLISGRWRWFLVNGFVRSIFAVVCVCCSKMSMHFH